MYTFPDIVTAQKITSFRVSGKTQSKTGVDYDGLAKKLREFATQSPSSDVQCPNNHDFIYQTNSATGNTSC